MEIFFLTFIVISSLTLVTNNNKYLLNNIYFDLSAWILLFLFLIFFIGFRYEVGGDWDSYIESYIENLKGQRLTSELLSREPFFKTLGIIGSNYIGGIYFINTISAIIFTISLIFFCKSLPYPWIGFLTAFPYLVTVVALGYTRQSISIGLFMITLVFLKKNKFWKYLIINFLAIGFHFSSFITLPLVMVQKIKRRKFYFFVGLSLIVLFFIAMKAELSAMIENYLEIDYASKGALIRLIMLIIPTLIFFKFKKNFEYENKIEEFWTYLGYLSILFFILYFVSPSSTAVDRFALFVIPFQMFVWSHVPNLLSKKNSSVIVFIIFFIFYNFSILWVWLFHSIHSNEWLPYKNYIFELWKYDYHFLIPRTCLEFDFTCTEFKIGM